MRHKALNFFVFTVLAICLSMLGCDKPASSPAPSPKSASGVSMASGYEIKPVVRYGGKTLTYEQYNIARYRQTQNTPGKVMHLYVVSLFSGDVIFYDTVFGKTTSGGKRNMPKNVAAGQYAYSYGGDGNNHRGYGMVFESGGQKYFTSELIQDDGTFGDSNPYLHYSNARGIIRKLYVPDMALVIESETVMRFPKILVNLMYPDQPDKQYDGPTEGVEAPGGDK